jgi:enolase
VSLAGARAAAEEALPLWRYLGGDAARPAGADDERLNGGRTRTTRSTSGVHGRAGRRAHVAEAAMGAEVFHRAQEDAARPRLGGGVGDEGGFAPNLSPTRRLRALIEASRRRARPARTGIASTPRQRSSTRRVRPRARGRTLSARAAYWVDLRPLPDRLDRDGMDEEDWAAGSAHRRCSATTCSSSATTCSSPTRSARHRPRRRNSILIKVSQIGTLTETLGDRDGLAGYTAVMRTARARPRTRRSPTWRSTGCGQIKTGAPAVDRVAKYNQLLRSRKARRAAEYPGKVVFRS